MSLFVSAINKNLKNNIKSYCIYAYIKYYFKHCSLLLTQLQLLCRFFHLLLSVDCCCCCFSVLQDVFYYILNSLIFFGMWREDSIKW